MLVAGGAVGYWLYGDRLPSVLSRAASGAADKVTDAAVRTSERLDSQEGSRIAAEQEARRRAVREARDRELGWVTIGTNTAVTGTAKPLAPLSRRNGPAYVSLDASQVAGVLGPLFAQLPPSANTVQLALQEDRVLLRAAVALRDFAGQSAFGAVLGKAITGEDTLYLSGPIEPVRPGLAQLRVQELRIKGLDVPTRLIPSLVASLRERARGTTVPADTAVGRALAADGLPIPLPTSVSDVRVVNGKLTLYRNASASTSTPKR